MQLTTTTVEGTVPPLGDLGFFGVLHKLQEADGGTRVFFYK